MSMNVSKSLIELANIFRQNGGALYIVGGYVRNAILGFCETDIDLCGPMTVGEIEQFLDKDLYKINVVNPKLGTIHISPKYTDEEYEYTTFRAENYAKGGAHSPTHVEFVRDITLDASRRDFTANCIYYDICEDKIVDFYNGVSDVNSHILRTVETPEYVFSSDGLRMLRMVRIACELDFNIDSQCFDTAKSMISQLADISHERFNKEIVSILFADYKYNYIKNPHACVMGLRLLSNLGAWRYILPEIVTLVGADNLTTLLTQNWLHLTPRAPAPHRVTAFVIDMLTALGLELNRANVSKILGTTGIMLQKSEVDLQARLVEAFVIALRGFANDDEKRLFVQSNSQIWDRLLGLVALEKPTDDLSILRDVMVLDGVPMTIAELAINGNDLMRVYPTLDKTKYSEVFEYLLKLCCESPEINKPKILLDIVGKKFVHR